MTRAVIFNDPHYTRTPPECRAESYRLEILQKLHRVRALAEQVGAPVIACSGDWFHRRGRATFHESNDLLAVLADWNDRGLSAIGILGNHDLPGAAGLDAMDNRASGALHHGRVLHVLDLAPWIRTDESGGLYVTGTSYFAGCDRDDDARARMYGAPPAANPDLAGSTVHMHLAHGALCLTGSFFEEHTRAEELIGLLHERGRLPDVIVSGHLHFPEGVRWFDRPDGSGRKVAVARIGSIGRVSRDDLTRIPAALVMTTKGREFALKEFPVGEPVQASAAPEGDPSRPEEHEARIREFADRLREQAEQVSELDLPALLQKAAEVTGASEEVVQVALAAVEKRR